MEVDYIKAFDDTLEFIYAVAISKLDKIQLIITVYNFFIRIYTYFGKQSEVNHYKELLTHKRTEEKIMVKKKKKELYHYQFYSSSLSNHSDPNSLTKHSWMWMKLNHRA